jgi:beta-phosphoglucomutase-like phosphatase (HAD superfamily)
VVMRVALKVSAFILFTFLMSLRLTTSLLQKLSIKTCRTCLKSSFSSSPYSLLMDTPIVIRGFVDIADRYDLFLFDQFGVLHDGASPIKGTIELLDQLEKLKKTVVIVSNTSGKSLLNI